MKKKNKAFNDWFMLAFVAVGCGLWSYSHTQGKVVADAIPSSIDEQANPAGQEQSADDSSVEENNSQSKTSHSS